MFLLRRLIARSFKGDADGKNGNSRLSNPKLSEVGPSRKALDKAGEYVREGKYERALLLLEKLGQLNPGVKGVGELVAVAEVCYAAVSRSCMCLSRKPGSPDWYKILKVDENSDIEVIKKRYRQLALLLHPDKNKHVKAEGAFKLVSEAYACLSDTKKRANFNTQRFCGRCLQPGAPTAGPERWSGYDCSRECRTTKFRRARSVPDTTEADWLLDQEKLKMFREKARARVLRNLADAWKERLYKSMGEFHLPRVKSHGRKNHKNMPPKEAKHPEQQKPSTEQQHVDTVKDVKTKPVSSSSKVVDDATQGKASDYEVSRPCKSLDALICELRAELNASSNSSGNEKPQRQKNTCHEPVAGSAIKTESKAKIETGSTSKERCKVWNSLQKCGAEGKDLLKRFHGPSGTENVAAQRQMGTFMEPSVVLQADHNCSSSTRSSNSDLCDSLEKHSFNSDNNLANRFLSRNISSKVCSNITYSLHHGESGNPKASPDKVHSDCCTGGIEDNFLDHNRHATFACNGRKLVEEKRTSGANSSAVNTFLEDLLKQRTKARGSSDVESNVDQYSPFMQTVCMNNLSNSRVCRGDSLDREHTILQTQMEKSEQLLKTLQRLREEAKSVAVSLNNIRNDHDNRGERCSFQNSFSAPSYQAFVWDTDG